MLPLKLPYMPAANFPDCCTVLKRLQARLKWLLAAAGFSPAHHLLPSCCHSPPLLLLLLLLLQCYDYTTTCSGQLVAAANHLTCTSPPAKLLPLPPAGTAAPLLGTATGCEPRGVPGWPVASACWCHRLEPSPSPTAPSMASGSICRSSTNKQIHELCVRKLPLPVGATGWSRHQHPLHHPWQAGQSANKVHNLRQLRVDVYLICCTELRSRVA
jgi:hypothetical protein